MSKQDVIGRVLSVIGEGKLVLSASIKLTILGFWFFFFESVLSEVLVTALLHTYMEELCSV